MTLRPAINDVKDFHNACAVPIVEDGAKFPSDERVDLRLRILHEEFVELYTAIEARDLIETADAIADAIYVAIGTALEFGIPLERVWAEVQRSNMAKRDPETGEVRHRDDGKVLKPEGWLPPNIAAAIGVPSKRYGEQP